MARPFIQRAAGAAWIAAVALCLAGPAPSRAADETPPAAEQEQPAAAGGEEAPAPAEGAGQTESEAASVQSPVVETEKQLEQPPETAVTPRWQPPEPEQKGWDWLRTTSGEWLKGELTRMRDREFEFDSDEFDDVKVDQEDVAYFRFSRPHTYRFRGREIVRGTAELRDGLIKIRTRDGEIVERDATLLDSISRGAGGELERWTVDMGVGATIRQGNTDQTDISGRADIRRETTLTRYRLLYNGAWAQVEGDKTANNHRVLTALDFFITWRFYATVPFLEFFSDEFQNIDARYTPGIGLGYEIIDSSRVEWDVTGGVAYQHTVYSSGAASNSNDAALIFGTSLELEITDDLDWDSSYSLQLVATDLGKTNHHAESLLSFDLWGPIDFDVNFVWDRIESPETSEGGSTPKKDDFRLTVGLAVDF